MLEYGSFYSTTHLDLRMQRLVHWSRGLWALVVLTIPGLLYAGYAVLARGAWHVHIQLSSEVRHPSSSALPCHLNYALLTSSAEHKLNCMQHICVRSPLAHLPPCFACGCNADIVALVSDRCRPGTSLSTDQPYVGSNGRWISRVS